MPAELDAVILACLAKEPEQRPGSARELRRRLREVPLVERWCDEEAEAWWIANLRRGGASENASLTPEAR